MARAKTKMSAKANSTKVRPRSNRSIETAALEADSSNTAKTVARKAKHKWAFTSKFRAGAYGWNGSKLACQRIKEAISEINKLAKKEPELAAEGGVVFLEKLVPAIQNVDSSTGALGSAAARAVEAVAELLGDAPLMTPQRQELLERVFEAYQDDGYGYLDRIGDNWHVMLGPMGRETAKALAEEWVSRLLPLVREVWRRRSEGSYEHFKGVGVCIASLYATGRYEDLLLLLDEAPTKWWFDHIFGAYALRDLGRLDEAIDYAEDLSKSGGYGGEFIAEFCEGLLLEAGRREEAFARYGLNANQRPSNLGTFQAIKKKYPEIQNTALLSELVRACPPGKEGGYFATAKELDLLDFALDLAAKSPSDPRTLTRAARDFETTNPSFAHQCAFFALKWISEGYGYEITNFEIVDAFLLARSTAKALGCENDFLVALKELIQKDAFMAKALAHHLEI